MEVRVDNSGSRTVETMLFLTATVSIRRCREGVARQSTTYDSSLVLTEQTVSSEVAGWRIHGRVGAALALTHTYTHTVTFA